MQNESRQRCLFFVCISVSVRTLTVLAPMVGVESKIIVFSILDIHLLCLLQKFQQKILKNFGKKGNTTPCFFTYRSRGAIRAESTGKKS